MNKLLNSKAPATEQVNPLQYSIGEEMDKQARAFGVAQSEVLGSTINTIAKAKQDYEGGPFAVMFKVTANMSKEQLDELPIPGSELSNHPAKYKLRVIGDKGKPSVKEFNYYNVVSDSLACNVAKQDRINKLELSLGDPSKVNMVSVPQDIKDMEINYRHTEISRLKGELNTSRNAVNNAFELLFQIRAVNELAGVEASPIMALTKDGTVSDTEVENTRTPMLVTTTQDKRKAIDTVRLSISSFKKLKPAVAKENGGTYEALMNTVKRGTKGDGTEETGGNKPDLINTVDKFQARTTDYHDYLDKVWSAKDKAEYQELLKIVGPRGPAGSDDFALSLYSIFTMLGDIYRHDAVRARAEALKEAEAVTPATGKAA